LVGREERASVFVVGRPAPKKGRGDMILTLALEAGDDLGDQPALHAVGLDHDVGALGGHLADVGLGSAVFFSGGRRVAAVVAAQG
jgi:hypothetical protein